MKALYNCLINIKQTLTMLSKRVESIKFKHNNKLTSMIGERIPLASSSGKKANTVVVWTKDTGDNKEEIRAQFFYLPPVE